MGGNFIQAQPYVGVRLDRHMFDEVRALVRRYLAGPEKLFIDGVRQGAVVDGHGDLLAEDIFLLPDGARILDCIEFDDQLRYLDRIDDAACLVTDLESLGDREGARVFLEGYVGAAHDHVPASLAHHYIAYRAFVRAKVCLCR